MKQLDTPASCRCRVYLFGLLAVSTRADDGGWTLIERGAWGSNDYPQSVLKRLLATPGQRLSRGRLVEELWPDLDEERVDNYLDKSISLVRKALVKDLVTTWKSTYPGVQQGFLKKWAIYPKSSSNLR